MCPEECYELTEKDDKCRRNTKKGVVCLQLIITFSNSFVNGKFECLGFGNIIHVTLKVKRKTENCSPKANLIFECSLNANRKQLRIFLLEQQLSLLASSFEKQVSIIYSYAIAKLNKIPPKGSFTFC